MRNTLNRMETIEKKAEVISKRRRRLHEFLSLSEEEQDSFASELPPDTLTELLKIVEEEIERQRSENLT